MTGVSSEYDTRDSSVKNILGKLQPWRNVSFTWDLVLLVLKFYYDRKTPSECQGWAEVQVIVLSLFPRGKFFWTTHLCLRRLVQGEGHALCSCREPAAPFPLLLSWLSNRSEQGFSSWWRGLCPLNSRRGMLLHGIGFCFFLFVGALGIHFSSLHLGFLH